MISFKKKVFTSVGIVAVTVGMAFNLNDMRTNDADIQITLVNVEALAGEGDGEGEGNFPACMCGDGTGANSKVYQCINKKCEYVDGKKGTLNVNYCSKCNN